MKLLKAAAGFWVLGAGWWALAQQPVDVVQVVSRTAERKIVLPGEFLPYQTVAIYAKVTGFVIRSMWIAAPW